MEAVIRTSSRPRKRPEPAPARARAVTPEINVTPLVDVVLVLLIIFMVIAPALEHGERVELPGVLVPDKKQRSKLDPLTITVARSGTVYVEKVPTAKDALPAQLAELHAREPERRVVLKGDSGVEYARVREIFATVQRAGFTGVSLMVSKKGRGEEPPEGGE